MKFNIHGRGGKPSFIPSRRPLPRVRGPAGAGPYLFPYYVLTSGRLYSSGLPGLSTQLRWCRAGTVPSLVEVIFKALKWVSQPTYGLKKNAVWPLPLCMGYNSSCLQWVQELLEAGCICPGSCFSELWYRFLIDCLELEHKRFCIEVIKKTLISVDARRSAKFQRGAGTAREPIYQNHLCKCCQVLPRELLQREEGPDTEQWQ